MLTQQPLPGGFRIGVLSNAGGMGVITAGMAEGEGLSVPVLSSDLQDRLRELLPLVGAANPVDLGAEVSPASVQAAVRLVLESGEVDAAVVTLVPTTLGDPVALRRAAAAAALDDRPARGGRRLGRRPRRPGARAHRLPHSPGRRPRAGAGHEVRRVAPRLRRRRAPRRPGPHRRRPRLGRHPAGRPGRGSPSGCPPSRRPSC